MLKRIRLEVEAESPEHAVRELDRYEHALQTVEAERYCLGSQDDWQLLPWATPNDWRSFHNEELGRDLTEEVIELEPGANYVARRVVRFKRLDMRQIEIESALEMLQRGHWQPAWDDNPKVIRLHWEQEQAMTKEELKAALLQAEEPRRA